MNNYKLNSFVNDFSGVIDENIEREFNKKFFEYESKSGVQIATVFISHRNGRELKDIALEIFNNNGIGDKQTNSGLLLIVVTGEKKIRIMTGKGMEIEFPDSLARDIIQLELRGLLNSGKYNELLQSWFELSTKSRKVKRFSGNFTKSFSSSKSTNSDIEINNSIIFPKVIGTLFSGIFGATFFNIFGVLSFGMGFLLSVLLSILVSFFILKIKNKTVKSILIFGTVIVIIIVVLFISGSKNNNNGLDSGSTINSGYNFNIGNSSSTFDSSSSSSPSYNSSWGGGSSNGGGYGD